MTRITLLLLLVLPLTAQALSAEVAFSPDQGATDLIVRTIGEAKSSVRVAAYSFTSKPVAEALLDACKRGVDVEVVLDKSNATAQYSSATFLANSGIPTRIDSRYAIMHNKFILVDGATVETGSFNFTAAAERRNAENAIVLHDAGVAAKYSAEWQRLWNESEAMNSQY